MASYQFMDQILLEEPLGSFLFHALLLPTSCSYFIFFLSLKTELTTCNVSCPSPKGSLLRLLTDISVWEAPECFAHASLPRQCPRYPNVSAPVLWRLWDSGTILWIRLGGD